LLSSSLLNCLSFIKQIILVVNSIVKRFYPFLPWIVFHLSVKL